MYSAEPNALPPVNYRDTFAACDVQRSSQRKQAFLCIRR
jgi:hypothetical protein